MCTDAEIDTDFPLTLLSLYARQRWTLDNEVGNEMKKISRVTNHVTNALYINQCSWSLTWAFMGNPSYPKINSCMVVELTKSVSISTGVSSSGIMYKHPGRVGDSPLPGSGLYAG